LGKIETTNPAFISIEKFKNDPEFLLISEFGALSSGKVSYIKDIKDIVNKRTFSQAQREVLYANFKWPNSIAIVPQDVFNDG
jgi:hypothetical protein